MEYEDLETCESITGLIVCNDDDMPIKCYEPEEEGEVCKHCWIQNGRGRCEVNPK